MKKLLAKIDIRAMYVTYSLAIFALCFTGVFAYVAENPGSFSFSNTEVVSEASGIEPMSTSIATTMEKVERLKEIVTSEESIENVEDSKKEQVVVYEEYYDVPLDEELQDHIVDICKSYGVDPSIVIAMIKTESSYRDWVVSDSGKSYGLMQIQLKWHKERMKSLGCNDLFDPYQNVLVGIDILAELMSTGNSIEWCLMAYNGGYAYANNKIKNGEISKYAQTVLYDAEHLATYQYPAK